ncbi:MAG: response regulator [Desulfovermiculus sp.]|nr:response regulator [Desulfovermiculus sp.]
MENRKILIVDDESPILRLLERTVEKIGCQTVCALSAEEARTAIAAQSFDLLLCDLYLPGESGMELVRWVRAEYPHIGVIMVSGEDSPQVAEQALEMGVFGYIIKPFKANEIIINISSALRRQQLEAENRARQEDLGQLVNTRTTELQRAFHGIIQAISQILESRDPYTAGHQQRVSELALALSHELDCPPEQRTGLYYAGMIHDLGKIAIPSEILSKPTRLTHLEFGLIKGHSQAGYNMLKDITFPWPIAEIILQHHERIDGSGYPQGLQSEDILFEAKILAVADVVEAMTSHRPYRPGLGIEAALEEIEQGRGTLYDPDVVDACLGLFRDKGDGQSPHGWGEFRSTGQCR